MITTAKKHVSVKSPVAVPGSDFACQCRLVPCRPLPLAPLPVSATRGGQVAPLRHLTVPQDDTRDDRRSSAEARSEKLEYVRRGFFGSGQITGTKEYFVYFE